MYFFVLIHFFCFFIFTPTRFVRWRTGGVHRWTKFVHRWTGGVHRWTKFVRRWTGGDDVFSGVKNICMKFIQYAILFPPLNSKL